MGYAHAVQADLFDPHPRESDKEESAFGTINVKEARLTPTPVFDAYWRFAAERQEIFFRRHRRYNSPRLTDDPVLAEFKFTNAYRASDRVSQYLIREVIYNDAYSNDPSEVFFRIILFKIFNKIETWDALVGELGVPTWSEFSFDLYDRILSQRKADGLRNYSAAYIMPSAGRVFGHSLKHQNHLRLLEWMFASDFPTKLSQCETMEAAFRLLLSAPSIGAFLAYQYVTDFNYSELTNFSEHEFVVAGPGALDGISKCFAGRVDVPAETIIRHMYDNQDGYFGALGLDFRSLWGRRLQLIDCQNLFCEISKYSRVAFPDIAGVSGRTRIKQRFNPKTNPPLPWYPPKWGLNASIRTDLNL